MRLKDRRHVAGEGLDLLGASLAGVEDGDLQGDKRHVIGHVAGGKLPANPGKERNPLLDIAKTRSDAPFGPHEPYPIQLPAGFK